MAVKRTRVFEQLFFYAHTSRRIAALAVFAYFAVSTALTSDARAEETQVAAPIGTPSSDSSSPLGRPHTVAELEAGIIALPNAPISKGRQANSLPFGSSLISHGDATILTGLHFLYRGGPDWSLGAGFLFGPDPTGESASSVPGATRTHSRNYLTIGGEARYIPLRSEWVEGWVGLSVGGVIIADHYLTDTPQAYDQVPSILGTRESTVRTEGYTLGVQAGANWLVTRTWVLGFTGRLDRWFLPSSPACTAFGDCATITGSVTAIELGLTLGYRVSL